MGRYFTVAPPLGIDFGINELAANEAILHHGPHGIDHIDGGIGIQSTGAGQGNIPAHGIPGYRNHLIALGIDIHKVTYRAGIDEG